MRSVYLISHGSYSDYSVDYVCFDKEIAERICTKLNIGRNYDQYEVEERSGIESPDEVITLVTFVIDVDHAGNETRRWSYVTDHLASEPPREAEHGWSNSNGAMGSSNRSFDAALRLAREKLNASRVK